LLIQWKQTFCLPD